MQSTTIPTELAIAMDQVCILSVECWRINRIAELFRDSDEAAGLRYAVRRIAATLKGMGIEVVDFAGRTYDSGMVPEVVEIREDRELPDGPRHHRGDYCTDGNLAWSGYGSGTNHCKACAARLKEQPEVIE